MLTDRRSFLAGAAGTSTSCPFSGFAGIIARHSSRETHMKSLAGCVKSAVASPAPTTFGSRSAGM